MWKNAFWLIFYFKNVSLLTFCLVFMYFWNNIFWNFGWVKLALCFVSTLLLLFLCLDSLKSLFGNALQLLSFCCIYVCMNAECVEKCIRWDKTVFPFKSLQDLDCFSNSCLSESSWIWKNADKLHDMSYDWFYRFSFLCFLPHFYRLVSVGWLSV